MKKSRMVFFIALAVILSGPAYGATLFFEPSASVLDLGQNAGIAVWISGIGGAGGPYLGGFDLTINYDATILTLQSISFSDYLGYPLSSQNEIAGSGSLQVQEVSFLSVGALENLQPAAFPLLSLDFKTIALGESLLSFQNVVLSNADGTGSLPDTQLLSATMTAVPEPVSMLLYSTGVLIGTVYLRRRQQRR